MSYLLTRVPTAKPDPRGAVHGLAKRREWVRGRRQFGDLRDIEGRSTTQCGLHHRGADLLGAVGQQLVVSATLVRSVAVAVLVSDRLGDSDQRARRLPRRLDTTSARARTVSMRVHGKPTCSRESDRSAAVHRGAIPSPASAAICSQCPMVHRRFACHSEAFVDRQRFGNVLGRRLAQTCEQFGGAEPEQDVGAYHRVERASYCGQSLAAERK